MNPSIVPIVQFGQPPPQPNDPDVCCYVRTCCCCYTTLSGCKFKFIIDYIAAALYTLSYISSSYMYGGHSMYPSYFKYAMIAESFFYYFRACVELSIMVSGFNKEAIKNAGITLIIISTILVHIIYVIVSPIAISKCNYPLYSLVSIFIGEAAQILYDVYFIIIIRSYGYSHALTFEEFGFPPMGYPMINSPAFLPGSMMNSSFPNYPYSFGLNPNSPSNVIPMNGMNNYSNLVYGQPIQVLPNQGKLAEVNINQMASQPPVMNREINDANLKLPNNNDSMSNL